MTDETPASAGSNANEAETGERHVSVEGLKTYLSCPRRYQYEHVQGLTNIETTPQESRLNLLRQSICDALRAGDVETLEHRALERFDTLWAAYGEGFHSFAQRKHERRVLEAAIRAYVETVGNDHADHLYTTRSMGVTGELVGPGLPLTATVPATREDERIWIDATVDYAFLDGSSFVGVRFVPTPGHLGLLRYASGWDGDVEAAVVDHFDPDTDRFEPALVGTLFETATVLEGLRSLSDRLELETARTCRYLQLPVLDRSQMTVNWVREHVETTLEPVDLTDPYLDHQTFGMTHEHRNQAVDEKLKNVATVATTKPYDPSSRWEQISREVCPTCSYTVCCSEYISGEVSFNE